MFDKDSLQKLLSNAIPLLCKNGLPMHSSFRVDVMIGITVGDDDVSTLICFSESVVGNESDSEPFDAISHPVVLDGGELKQKFEDETLDSHERQRYDDGNLIGKNNIQNINIKTEPGIFIGKIKARKSGCQHRKLNNADCNTDDQPNDEAYPNLGVKHEINGDDVIDTGGGCENVNELLNDDCYVDEPEIDNADTMQGSDNIESWAEGDWNDNYEQNEANNKFVNKLNKRHSSLESHRRSRIQRVNINDSQAMESVGLSGQNSILPSSSSEYNNLMQDICNSMVSQSTAFSGQSTALYSQSTSFSSQSKRRNSINNNFSSTSPVTCHICHATLSNTHCLRNHIQGTHLALKLKRCNICGETFKWAMQLARHKKRVHGDGTYLNIYNV